ncbi:MAG: RnfABCDGE type electron transport complex subunit A [Deltaproteobacteria bacterium]|nr:RnfABCDGE type electron transport complex subunit A [Deltaproteobacteria bacterium]
MEHLFLIFFSVVIVNNFILAKFLGLCPFFGVSREIKSAFSMGLAVVFVMVIASIVTWFVHRYVLIPYDVAFLQTIVFILVIATLVQFVELVIAKVSPVLQRVMGIYLPLITTNCAVLGVCLINIQANLSLIETIVHGLGAGVGFMLAICIMAGIRERLTVCNVPVSMQGFPLSFIIGCLMALSFFGFQGFLVN